MTALPLRLRPVALIRHAWRRLISMRTALVLLFALSLAAVPGSLFPQRSLNPAAVTMFVRSHRVWGPLLDRIGLFDVFGSVWFAAIYLLLFLSLIGCLVPRIRVHVRGLRRQPLPAPRVLSRLPHHDRLRVAPADDLTGDAVDGDQQPSATRAAREVQKVLGRRWRTVVRTGEDGAQVVSAEKGYSRETGNLLFHISLLAALILIAVGRLFHYEGSIIQTEGNSFCNTVTSYDVWRPGRIAASGGISPAPFCVGVDKFVAKYLPTGEPKAFEASIHYSSYTDGVDGPVRYRTLEVNDPLRYEGDRLYLIGHGFSPIVTVRMPDGSTVRGDIAAFIPSDQRTLLSQGAFSEDGPIGAGQDIGIQGIFAPTPALTSPGVYTSVAPQVTDPVLGVRVWRGDLGRSRGLPQSVYSIDTSRMKQIGAANLRVGQSTSLPGGVTVTFDGYKQWVALQISHDPVQKYLLYAAAAMIAGLFSSLIIKRRRIWVRITPEPLDGSLLLELGGLGRTDGGDFAVEFAALRARMAARFDGEARQLTRL